MASFSDLCTIIFLLRSLIASCAIVAVYFSILKRVPLKKRYTKQKCMQNKPVSYNTFDKIKDMLKRIGTKKSI